MSGEAKRIEANREANRKLEMLKAKIEDISLDDVFPTSDKH